ncbi:MAG: hypothetical protein MJE68_01050 [Proteobacteria bacterium]|nr:hypothetical protein [Pseudomonadota bacterium]
MTKTLTVQYKLERERREREVREREREGREHYNFLGPQYCLRISAC